MQHLDIIPSLGDQRIPILILEFIDVRQKTCAGIFETIYKTYKTYSVKSFIYLFICLFVCLFIYLFI